MISPQIKIITDATVSAGVEDADRLGAQVVPIGYLVGEHLYYEKYIDPNSPEAQLSSGRDIATAQPSSAYFQKLFEAELGSGHEVLCITISSKLSGIYNAALKAAAACGTAVRVFDSGFTAGGLYLLVSEAQRLVVSGIGMNALIRRLSELKEKIEMYFSVGDMTPLRKSGRIGYVRLRVATIMNQLPILSVCDGRVVYDSIARGSADRIKKLAAKVTDGTREAVINYISEKSAATDLYNVIKSKYPHVKIRLSQLGSILGSQLGDRVLALSLIKA